MAKLKHLESLLKQGRISRRDFMGRAAALGVTISMASSLWSTTALSATPKKGGTLRIGIGHGSTTNSLDPATFEDAYMQFVGMGLRNHLTEVSNDDKLIPELAESWEASADASQWTFNLRKGVEFHNAKTMDADDVVASYNHHRGEDSKSAAKGVVDPIVDIKTDGKNTVVFTLREGNADFPYIASDYHIAIMPAKDGKIEWESGVGTGGYKLKSYEPGVRSTFERNPNYWKEGAAHFDSAEVLAIIDQTARTNALTTGEIDVMDRVELKTLHLLERNPDINILESSGTAHYSIPMRTDTPPFDNNHVRMALKYAVDREALLQSVLRGHGVVGNDHPIGQNQINFATELPQRTYDIDKAKFHLKKAGLSTLTVDLSAADAAFDGAVDAAVLYKEHAAPAGITINVIREPNDGYWSNVWMKKPWGMCYWGGRPTADWMFSIAYAEGANWNDTFWVHERFNVLLKQARSELDLAKRREMYVEMQTIVSDEGGVVVPMFNNYVLGLRANVGHNRIASNWTLDGLKGMERWWFS